MYPVYFQERTDTLLRLHQNVQGFIVVLDVGCEALGSQLVGCQTGAAIDVLEPELLHLPHCKHPGNTVKSAIKIVFMISESQNFTKRRRIRRYSKAVTHLVSDLHAKKLWCNDVIDIGNSLQDTSQDCEQSAEHSVTAVPEIP